VVGGVNRDTERKCHPLADLWSQCAERESGKKEAADCAGATGPCGQAGLLVGAKASGRLTRLRLGCGSDSSKVVGGACNSNIAAAKSDWPAVDNYGWNVSGWVWERGARRYGEYVGMKRTM